MMRVTPHSPSLSEPRPLRGAGLSIVVVEDSHSVGHILAGALEAEGCAPVIARGADEGVELARRLQPDLITVRARCGGDVLARLAEDSATRHIPVVAICSRRGDVAADQVKKVLGEPFYVTDVVDAALDVLGRR
jgi:DNA-binding response OmpR family regulator